MTTYILDFGRLNVMDSDIDKGIDHVYELMRNGKGVTILGDVINNESYIGCSFVYKSNPEYLIYNKDNATVFSSLGVSNLPTGELKGMVDNDTFILMINPYDLIDFIEENDEYKEKFPSVGTADNSVVVLFKLGAFK